MPVTSTDIANQALILTGFTEAPPVTGVNPTFDDSPAGKALQRLYGPAVQTVARQFGYDFARNTVALTASGNTPTAAGWAYEYLYPSNGVQVWQVLPATVADPYDPLPTNFQVANTLVSGTQTKVIQTDVVNARAVYNNNPTESTWDPEFREAVVRLLASELALALAAKTDMADFLLKTGSNFAQISQTRDD